jgi:hypothetical protein
MKRVSVIGIGNLGLRHLESLINSKMNLEIYALDPSMTAIQNAVNFTDEINYDEKLISVKFISKIGELPKDIDLVIVSTNSNIRFKVVNNLLLNSKIKFLVLEKVLFQRLKDYEDCNSLLENNNVITYVNCPMRSYQIYTKIKSLIDHSAKIKMLVSGGDWSLGCNSIHYIDLFSFLNNSSIITCDLNLDKEIINSKRNGFIEFTGKLKVTHKESSLLLNSVKDKSFNKVIKIYSKENLFILNENSANFEHFIGDKKISNYNFNLPYQSEITKVFASDLLTTGKCQLPTYKESMEMHIIIINELINFVKSNVDSKLDYINIT